MDQAGQNSRRNCAGGASGKPPKGVMEADYHEGRKRKRSLVYRLARRTREVSVAIRSHLPRSPHAILDVGTADGMMLDNLQREFGLDAAVGVDRSLQLLRTNTAGICDLVLGDACSLPVGRGRFDAVIATAVIEHLDSPEAFLDCSRGVLRSDGLLILTTPVPFFEQIATAIGHLPPEDHQTTFTLKELRALVQSRGFEVVVCQRFMMSPVGFPGELGIEWAMRHVGLGWLLLNQLLVARPTSTGQPAR